MKSKILLSFFILLFSLIFEINLATGQDTIPPIISISQEQINDNYPQDQADTYYESSPNNDTLTVYLSCRYSFPDEYYFYLVNATIQDESGILNNIIVVDTIIYDNNGYGTLIQTIIAEDNFGNTSNFVIISKIGAIYDFEFFGIRVDGIDVYYSDLYSSLEQTDFEFCEIKNVGVDVIYSMNGCTGTSRINWYKNDTLVSPNSENISIDLGREPDITELSLEAPFNNTNFQERIKLNIRKITKVSFVEITNPICSNPAEGIIKFDENVVEVTLLEHKGSDKSADYKYNNLNELYFDFLESGTYYVSYVYYNESIYDYCEFNDTITIVPENIFEFSLSDTIIDLGQNEILTIRNSSNFNGKFLWQIGDSTFIDNTHEFEYAFQFPGNYEIKLTDNSDICNDVIYKNILVEGAIPDIDTIPPTITIYVNGKGGDFFDNYISSGKGKDTLEIRFSCLYSFPGEYGPSYVNFEDDSEVLISNISLNKIIRDNINGVETGYGSVIQTIYAEDIYGNISELIVKSTIGDIYPFNFLGLDFEGGRLGNLYVPYLSNTFTLDQTDFVLCEDSKIDIIANTSKNGCTGNTNMNWYIDNRKVSSDPDKISIDLSQQNDSFMVAIEADFSNTNFKDKISFNIQKTVAQTEIQNPICSNSADGSIKLDSRIFGATWEHINSEALFLDSLKAGSYHVSYWFNDCNFNETITLIPENILDFDISDSVINLSKNELLTIRNLTNNIGESLWQIGDSTFINNSSEFDYAFKKAGNYEIKLTDNSDNCSDAISLNIIVEGILAEDDTISPTITITESQIAVNYFKDVSGFDGNFTLLNEDTLEITLSCIYSFPDDYYFKIENATIEDDFGIAKQTIVIDDITLDDEGYGSVVQTIIAEDNSGNTSKFVVITKYSGSEYLFNVFGIDVGGNIETNNDFPFILQNTDFEFCNVQNVDVVLLYSKNGCTSDARIDWYINNELVKINADNISVELSSKPDGFILEAEGKYNNTNFQDRIRINIQGRTLNFTVSDTIVDLNQNDKLTITNISKKIEESLWQIGDSIFVKNENEFDYTFKSPGNYEIKLTDNSGFCNETIVKNIVVEGTTSVVDRPVSSIKIGPNPFTDFLNINVGKSADYEITILGVDGRVYLKNQIYDKGNVQLNLGFLHTGIYVLNINSAKNSEPVKDFKIVKLIEN